ncbi:uncharacterized protein [Henckelia pumila]|uniref:uncharacterized protein n=1 Tax=Henckelia pumila TaxID=405737 RepID=UPI003C6E4D90
MRLGTRGPHNPSYVWRSLQSTKELIKKGARKRIGSGCQTKIWGDPWLPDQVNPCIESVCSQGLESSTVSSLRSAVDGSWDIDIIQDLFSERDQRLILSIPLSRQECDDNWMWANERFGVYSVKSGYNLQTNVSDTSPNSPSINWKFVWRLGIPAKVRNFIWRVLSSCLPTMQAFLTLRVEVNNCCPICHNLPEDDFHALVSCPWARSVWNISSIGSYFNSSCTFADWWINITHRRNQNDVELATAILWCLWQNRNDVVWNGKCKSATAIFDSAQTLYSQWKMTRKLHSPQINTEQQTMQERWIKPPE